MNKQILALLRDPEWRVNNLYRIVDKHSRRVVFKHNVPQQILFGKTSMKQAILKARQHGITTGKLVHMFDRTIFNENYTSCIMAHEQDSIKKIFSVVRRLYKFLHPDLRPEIAKGGGSQYELFFPRINSKIYCDLESRGDTINDLHISEAAFTKPERIASTMQAVPIDGRITLETTPNGFGNHFYEFWIGTTSYERIFLPWYVNPEYTLKNPGNIVLSADERDLVEYALKHHKIAITDGQIAFRRMKQDEPGCLFVQEYPENDIDCFLFSGTPAMNAQMVKGLLDQCPEPISTDGNGLEIFHKSSPKKTYVCGVDTASGVGKDACSAVIIDIQTMEEQACLTGHWEPFVFANKVFEMCKKYTKGEVWPYLVVESNNHGHAVILQLKHHLAYPNLYHHNDDYSRPGWITDAVSRPLMINTFIDAVHNNRTKINSKATLRECLALVDNKGKIEATEGFHDDRVMAYAIAVTVAVTRRNDLKVYEDIGSSILL